MFALLGWGIIILIGAVLTIFGFLALLGDSHIDGSFRTGSLAYTAVGIFIIYTAMRNSPFVLTLGV